MIPSGQSFSVGDTLGKGFATYFKNLPALLVMALIVYSPLLLYGALSKGPYEQESLEDIQTWSLVFALVIGFGSLVLTMVLAAAVTYLVVEELGGRHASIGKSISVGLSRLLPALAVGLLAGLCIVLGAVLLIVPGLILLCMFYVAVPASVIEKPGVGGALSRSAALTKGHRWQIFGLFILMFILGAALSFVAESALIDKIDVGDDEIVAPHHWKRYVFVTVGLQIITGALGAVMAATAYVGLRNDKEGVGALDLSKVFE
jgi:hypothetical protein